jgi:hypothetical protein
MDLLFLVLRWIHITSSIILVGGVFYYRFTVLPAVEALPPDHREAVSLAMRRNSAMIVRLAMLLLIVTGLVNMILVPKFFEFPVEGERGAYSMLVGLKFLLALPVFFIVDMMNGRSAMAEKFRAKSRVWLNVAVFLSIVIIVIGGYVRFIERTGKVETTTPVANADA